MVRPRRDEIGDVVRDFDAMAERLQLLVSSQKQLLSDISHELRSPLARLQVAVELARRKAGPDAEKDLNRIEAEGTRMNEMIGQILTLARADSDRPAVSEMIRPGGDRATRCDRHRLRGPPDRPRGARAATRETAIVLRRCGAARQRHRERRAERMPLYAAGHVRRHLAGRHADARRASSCAITGRAFRRTRSSAFSCRSIASALRAIATPAARGLASRSPRAPRSARRLDPRGQRGRRRAASDDRDPACLLYKALHSLAVS